ncbi:MAG: tetratricopeptide repeat protein [Planctomycetes bacterium]|nr:tetratricopeptide repeat protein [Planctomycetota bacterium]
MSAERFHELEPLFFEALGLQEPARSHFVDRWIETDPDLGERLRSLLDTASRNEDSSFEAWLHVDIGCDPEDSLPDVPGYVIEEEIGRGGQGVVYRARQHTTGRTVAVKLLHSGLESPEAQQRFAREVDVIARLDHHAIVKVLDTGREARGRAYLVMDHVEGRPLDRYVEEERLAPPEVLSLFDAVCEAVEYAHGKGVLHRDLKPSNVRVDEHGHVHLLDFGLARDLNPESREFSRTGRVLGTLATLAPEQVRGGEAAIDVRVDVYALGAVLYRLLSGSYPHTSNDDLLENLRRICEHDPTPLRTAWSIERRAGLTRIALAELEAIVHRALCRDRVERYPTVSALREEIRRHRRGLPVEAKVLHRHYRLRKAIRQHRALIATVSTFALLVVGSLILVTFAYTAERDALARERAALDVAEQRRAQAETDQRRASVISRFLQRHVLAAASPHVEPDRDLTLHEVLQRASRELPTEFRDDPGQALALHHVLGLIQWNLGEFEEAERHARAALRELSEDDIEQRTRFELLLANILRRRHELDACEPIYRQLLAVIESSRVPDASFACDVLTGYGAYCEERGAFEEARAAFERASRKSFDTGDLRARDRIQNALAELASRTRDFERAETILDDLLARLASTSDANDLLRLTAQHNLAHVYLQTTRLQEARDLLLDVDARRANVLGPSHPERLATLNARGTCALRLGMWDEAERIFREVVDGLRVRLGEDHPRTLDATCHLAQALGHLERFDEAEMRLRAALDFMRDDPERLLEVRNDLGWLLLEAGRPDQAEAEFTDTLERSIDANGERHPTSVVVLGNLALALHRQAKFDEARVRYRRALELDQDLFGVTHPNTVTTLLNLARCEDARGEHDLARRLLERGLERTKTYPAPNVLHGTALGYLGTHLLDHGDPTAAEANLLEAHAVLRACYPDDHERVQRIVRALVTLYGQRVDPTNAALWRERLR